MKSATFSAGDKHKGSEISKSSYLTLVQGDAFQGEVGELKGKIGD
jgi:hypothetical protein